jgi:hypothetical protein
VPDLLVAAYAGYVVLGHVLFMHIVYIVILGKLFGLVVTVEAPVLWSVTFTLHDIDMALVTFRSVFSYEFPVVVRDPLVYNLFIRGAMT